MRYTPASILVAALGATLALGACNQRSSTTAPSTGSTPPSTTERIADKASDATNKVAAAADDAAVTTKVKTALLAEPGLKSLQISVDTKDGTVTLTGQVDSADQRSRAEQIAQSTGGVKNVVDKLAVKS